MPTFAHDRPAPVATAMAAADRPDYYFFAAFTGSLTASKVANSTL
jgi:hypothetical protein